MKLIETIETFISGDWGNESHTEDTPCEVFCVRGADIEPIKNQDYNHIPKRYISKRSYENKLLQVGDIIVEKSGGSPTQSTGRVCLITPNLIEKLQSVDCSNFCAAFRVKKEWDAEYIYLYIQHFYNMGAFFNFEGKTSGIKNLQLEQAYQAIEIKPISIAEQKKLAKTIRTIDGKTAINRSINQNLEAMAKQLYDYWFVQFDFPNEEGKPYKSSGGEMVWNEKLKRKIPNEWDNCKLKDFINLFDSKRIPLSSKDREERKGNYPYYGATGIMDYVNEYIFDGDYILLAEDGSTSDSKGFPIVQYIWGKNWVNNHAHIILPKNEQYLMFTYQMLRSIPAKQIETGSIQKKISQENLCEYNMVLPNSILIEKYESIISPLWEKRKLCIEEINALIKQRDELLPLLMNGQASVNSDLSVYKKRRGKVPSSILNDVSDI